MAATIPSSLTACRTCPCKDGLVAGGSNWTSVGLLQDKVLSGGATGTRLCRAGGLCASSVSRGLASSLRDPHTLRSLQIPTNGRPARGRASGGAVSVSPHESTCVARAMTKPLQSTDEGVINGSQQTDAKSSAVAVESPSSNGLQLPVVLREPSLTGGAMSFRGATDPLVVGPLPARKTIVLVRHGLSVWNAESRIQGCSDLSLLSERGKWQAVQCREALRNTHFDCCFASPISRAKTSAELIWEGRQEPLIFMDSLREANLHFLEGMTNADAKRDYPELYRAWREDPLNFNVDGVFPVVNLFAGARLAWQDILSRQGEKVLVVTHKSILRALLCIALGLGPDRFRAMDINNSGVCIFEINKRGEPMLKALNMTAHLSVPGVLYDI